MGSRFPLFLSNSNELFLPSGEFEESSTLHNIQSRQALSQKLSKDNMSYATTVTGIGSGINFYNLGKKSLKYFI